MAIVKENKTEVTIIFAGDSGDGIQLTGTQFTDTAALIGNDISTFPNFPAEIRAPQGTLAGVSGFQLNFGSQEIFSPGDEGDVLVAMNAAALKANLKKLKKGGLIIANSEGFDPKNLKLSGHTDGVNPLTNGSLSEYQLVSIDITKLTRASLSEAGLSTKEADRSRNMFVLGFLYWLYSRPMEPTIKFLEDKFKKRPDLVNANVKALKDGYHFAETSETIASQYEVKPAKMKAGVYRNIMGNQATALGLIAAASKTNLELFYATYPITPASDILHELSKHKNFDVMTFQAEDEIAAICAAIGASFGGNLGVTASSGPGIALKGEAIGLALMLELPLVIINVQRGGPSTGLPTKTEQADLMQAIYGRNGEAPVAVVASSTPSDCFAMVYEACRIAIEHMTPVIFLSDGYIANGAEPWVFPQSGDLADIEVTFAKKEENTKFLPYKRDDKLSRAWAIPGVPGLEHRVGGLEKQHETGNISYDPENHEFMVNLRAEKIERIADFIPPQIIDSGVEQGKVLVLGWGSTYGAIKTAVKECLKEGMSVAHAHVKYMNPFPKNLETLMRKYDKVLIPEMNKGQLIKIIRDKYLIDAIGLHKVQGMPFSSKEIISKIKEVAG